MVVVAAAVALHGLAAQAAPPAEDAKPCRTPCLSASVPREVPVQPEAPPAAEKAEAVPVASPRPKPVAKPRPQASAAPAPSKRCSDINMRAAVGEPLSDQDMKTLRSEC